MASKAKYEIQWLKGSYAGRQVTANKAKCAVYVEQHLNALEVDREGSKDNPSMVLVASNASAASIALAGMYSEQVAKAFGTPNLGCRKLQKKDRGFYNLVYTHMPAVLLEPLFCSEKEHVKALLEGQGVAMLSSILADCLRAALPSGGLLGFSCGHGAKQGDKGAPLKNAAGEIVAWEAELCQRILEGAAKLLTSTPETSRESTTKAA
jgi:hypothetical protein